MKGTMNTIKALAALPKALLLKIAKVSGGDGHTIYSESDYAEHCKKP